MNSQEIVLKQKFKAIEKVIYDSYLKLYKDEASSDLKEFFDTYLPSHGAEGDIEKMNKKEVERYQSNLQLTPQKTKALMVTFSPDEKLNLNVGDLKKIAIKLTKPNEGIKSYILSIEQRGETEEEMGVGMHFHAVLELNKETQSGEVTRQVKRIVSQLGKYRTKTDHFLQIKRVSEDKFEDKWNYCMQSKSDPTKERKMEIDDIWRQQNGIKSQYYSLPTI